MRIRFVVACLSLQCHRQADCVAEATAPRNGQRSEAIHTTALVRAPQTPQGLETVSNSEDDDCRGCKKHFPGTIAASDDIQTKVFHCTHSGTGQVDHKLLQRPLQPHLYEHLKLHKVLKLFQTVKTTIVEAVKNISLARSQRLMTSKQKCFIALILELDRSTTSCCRDRPS